MRRTKLVISDMPLKQFLLLFDTAASINILALGDTMHPSSGFVGMEIVTDIKFVNQLIAYDYDFNGLVYFEAVIQNNKIKYIMGKYEIESDDKTCRKLEDRIREFGFLPENPKFTIIHF